MAIDGPESVTVEAYELIKQLGQPTVFLDVRFTVSHGDRRSDYEKAHIPGAYFVSLTEELAGPKTGHSGNRPLPEPAVLQANIRKWGINEDTQVVVYTDHSVGSAARAWFVLRWAGLKHVRYLNGGLQAWVDAGGKTTQNEPEYRDSAFVVTPESLPTLTTEQAAAFGADGILVDTRAEATYSGREQGHNTSVAAGHIPGAINIPSAETLDNGSFLKSAEEIQTILAERGITPDSKVGLYCGGGVAASLGALALRKAGIEAPVYIGSWSAWTSDPNRPVERSGEASAIARGGESP